MAPVHSVSTFLQTQGAPQKGEQPPITSSLQFARGEPAWAERSVLAMAVSPGDVIRLVPDQTDGSGLGPGLGGPRGSQKAQRP